MARVTKKQQDFNQRIDKLNQEKTDLMLKYVVNMNENIDPKEKLKARDRIKEIKRIIATQAFEEDTEEDGEIVPLEAVEKIEFKNVTDFKAKGGKVILKRGPII